MEFFHLQTDEFPNPERMLLWTIAFLICIVAVFLFVWAGSKVARVEKPTFGRAVIAAVLSSLVLFCAYYLALYLPQVIVETYYIVVKILFYLIVIAITMIIYKLVYKANWRKALIIWIFYFISQAIVLFVFVVAAFMTGL